MRKEVGKKGPAVMRLSSACGSRRVVGAVVTALLLGAAVTTLAPPASAASRQVPSVSRIAPSRGATSGGTRVTITGRNFRHVTAVRFGAARGKQVKVLSPGKLRVITPRHAAGGVAVRVITRSGASRTTKRTRFAFLPPPIVSRVLPGKGFTSGGTAVTVTGRNFTAVRSVLFGSQRGTSLHVYSSRKLRIVAPRHAAGSVDIRVISAYGRSASRSADRFTYLAPPPPPPTGTWGKPAPIATGSLPFDGISCAPSSTKCVAIEGNSAVAYDGTKWGNPTAVANGQNLTSVSCASATFCLATDAAGSVYTFDGTTWKPDTTLSATSGDRLSGASCVVRSASQTGCAVLDDATGDVWLLLTDASWTDAGPASGATQIAALSCAPALCWVVTADDNAATLLWPGSGTDPWGNLIPLGGASTPTSLSCLNTFCAVGETDQSVATRGTTTWPERALGSGTTAIDSVTCPASGFCMAMDQSGQYAVYTSSWTGLGPTGLAGLSWAGVSCSSPTFCVAADDQGNATVYSG